VTYHIFGVVLKYLATLSVCSARARSALTLARQIEPYHAEDDAVRVVGVGTPEADPRASVADVTTTAAVSLELRGLVGVHLHVGVTAAQTRGHQHGPRLAVPIHNLHLRQPQGARLLRHPGPVHQATEGRR
jgi:hypothetical protein